MNERLPQRYALLIGINTYPNCPEEDWLHGCINDILLWRNILTTRFSFPPDEQHVMVLQNPGRQAILNAFESHLIQQSGPGDMAVFVFAGHGAYTWDLEGDEPDGLDETLVPADGHLNPLLEPRHITDDEIFLLMARLKEKLGPQGFIVLIVDSCHSASITRGVGQARFLKPALPERKNLDLKPIVSPELLRLQGLGDRGWLPDERSFVLLAACRDDERAYETKGRDGKIYGAFTLFLTQSLERIIRMNQGTGRRATYGDLLERAAPYVRRVNMNQNPQLQGDGGRVLFGIERFDQESYLPVEAVSNQEVTLGGGVVHLVTEGSRYAIYPPGTRSLREAEQATALPLARVTVTTVGTIASRATFDVPPQRGLEAGCRAFEIMHTYGDMRFPVAVAGVEPGAADARRALEGSSLLRMVALDESPHLVVWALDPSAPSPAGNLTVPRGLDDRPSFAITASGGETLMRPTAADGDQALETLRENVERIAKHLNLLALENENPQAVLRGKIRLALKRLEQHGAAYVPVDPPFEQEPVLTEGDLFALEITSTHDQPVFFSALDLGLSWRISMLYPLTGQESEKLQSGCTFTIGLLPGGTPSFYPLSIPEVFPAERTFGRETFKVLVTTQPASFNWLTQPGVTIPLMRASDPLADLLALVRSGRTPDGQIFRTDDFAAHASQRWITEQVTFVLKRKGVS